MENNNWIKDNRDISVLKTVQPVKKAVIEPENLSVETKVNLVDKNASEKTAQLYAYMKAVGDSKYVIYGHQNETTMKAAYNGGSDSDTKDITGSLAGIAAYDALALTGYEYTLKEGETSHAEAVAEVMIKAAKEGSILSFSAHMPNFAEVAEKPLINGKYDYGGYTPNNTEGNVVQRIMPGGDLNKVYTGYLDMIAECDKIIEKENIPVIFRPFHENNGSWFWWGADFCSREEFKNLFRYTVEYMRDTKDIHNFLYAYSPNGPFTESLYLSRYPGDDYIDIVAFDMYHDRPKKIDLWNKILKSTVHVLDKVARKHNKIAAVSETSMRFVLDNGQWIGILPSNNPRPDWFNEMLNDLDGTNMAYVLTWADFDKDEQFYAPFMISETRGHEMINGFIDFYNDDRTIFAEGIGNYESIKIER